MSWKKRISWNQVGKSITPLCQYFVKPHFSLMTALSMLGNVPSSFAHLDFAIMPRSSKFECNHLWTTNQVIPHILMGFKCKLWLDHVSLFTFSPDLLPAFGKPSHHWILSDRGLQIFLRKLIVFCTSMLTRAPVPVAEKHQHNKILPPAWLQ